jgi:selenocysteine-specific translation elongation factor
MPALQIRAKWRSSPNAALPTEVSMKIRRLFWALAAVLGILTLALAAAVVVSVSRNQDLTAKSRTLSAENAELTAGNARYISINKAARLRATRAEAKARTAFAKAKAKANRTLARERARLADRKAQLEAQAADLDAREVELDSREGAIAEQENAISGTPDAGSGCHPSYEGECLDPIAFDYDCEGGSGDGPEYVGTVTVVGPDDYGLDFDEDGIGCE